MKGSEDFKHTIQKYLDDRAANDELFAVSYAKESKNIDDCISYILNTVNQSGRNGFSDAEIYSMAIHYYDEDVIDVGKPIKCSVVVNHAITLTEVDKQEAYELAKQRAIDEAYQKITNKKVKPAQIKTETPQVEQQNLF